MGGSYVVFGCLGGGGGGEESEEGEEVKGEREGVFKRHQWRL